MAAAVSETLDSSSLNHAEAFGQRSTVVARH